MAREVMTTTIGKAEYQINHLDNSAARKVLRRVLSAAAPLAGMQEAADIGEVLQRAMAAISDEDLDVITALFAAETKIKTEQSGGVALPLRGAIDDLFTGRGLSDYMAWIKACMDHNFAGFFADLRAQVAEVMDPEKASQSPNTSTGGSTE